MKFVTSNCSIGYPVYGAKFLNNRMLLVAGGGGEGSNGIPNKLTVLRIDFAKKRIIKRFREITLDPSDDSPTTLDVANNTILMGCNENSDKIKKGEGNHHLRKFLFENEHLKFVASIDFDRSRRPDDYTKLIYLSRDGSVGAIASSAMPTVIRIIDPKELTEKYEIETGHEVKDMHFAPDGKVIGYITTSTLEVISIVTGRFIIRKTDFDDNYSLSKIKFLTDDVILIAASLKKGSGIIMIKISLRSGNATVLKNRFLTNRFKGVTAMDVDYKNELAVLAGSDNSLALVKLKDLSLGRIFKQVHNFAITRVSFSPDSSLIASVSAANTVHVIKVPEGFAYSTSIWSKLWKLLLNFVLVALVAFLAQISLKYDLHNKLSKLVKEWYEERQNKSIVKREDSEQVTLVGAVSNVTPSVFPTYPISSDLIVSENDSAESISGVLQNPETTGLTKVSMTSPLIDQTTTKSLGSSIRTSGTTASSSEIPLDNATLKNRVSKTTKRVSITVTETPTRISKQTAVRSLTHHGPTPKASDSTSTTLVFDSEISDESVESQSSKTVSAEPREISLAWSSSPASASSNSLTSKEMYFSSATRMISIPTISTLSSSVVTRSNFETVLSHLEETRDSSRLFTGYQQMNVPISENTLTASSKTSKSPISIAHDKHEEDSVLVTTKAEFTPGGKRNKKSNLSTSPNVLSPSSSLQKTGLRSISTDGTSPDITVNTGSFNGESSSSFKDRSDKPLSVITESGSPDKSSPFPSSKTNGVSNSTGSVMDTVTKISKLDIPNSSTNVKSTDLLTSRSEISPYDEIIATDTSTQKETSNVSALVAGLARNGTLSRNSDVTSAPFSMINSEEILPESGEQLQTRSEPLQLHSKPPKQRASITKTMNLSLSIATSSHTSIEAGVDPAPLTPKANRATSNVDFNGEETVEEDGRLVDMSESNM